MIRHLFTLVWNRKRSNMLVMVELFFCFFVVAATMVAGVYCLWQYQYPMGFSHEQTWRLSIQGHSSDGTPATIRQEYNQLRHLLRALTAHHAVEAAAAVEIAPFSFSTHSSTFSADGRSVSCDGNAATEQLLDVLQLDIRYGRWFQQGDEALGWLPMVINERLSMELFGTENSVGKIFPSMFNQEQQQRRVVGVISDFRQDGELAPRTNYFFTPVSFTDTAVGIPSNILLKVAHGTPMAKEEEIVALAKAEVPEWSYKVETVEAMHTALLRQLLIPLVVVATVAVFLLLMVVLGLIGVIWQNVTRRTGEFGLRRAIGCTTTDIYRQIFGELFALTTFSIAAGLLVVVQVPLLHIADEIPTIVYGIGFTMSVLFMYVVALSCGIYPSILATRVQPTEALHYE